MFQLLCLGFFCMSVLVSGQMTTTDNQTPETLQVYQMLDDRSDQIQLIAQEMGAAVDALRTGRGKEFLKGTLSMTAMRENSQIQSGDFNPVLSGPLMAAPTLSNSSADVLVRPKRSYGRRYGNYGGYNRYNGGYGGYGRGYGSSYGYGNRYGGYGNMGYNRGYGYGRYNYYG